MDAESLKRAVQYGIANGKKNMIVDLDILGDILASRVPVGSNTLTPEELTERFYIVRGQRDQLIAAIQKIGRWCDDDGETGLIVHEIQRIVDGVRFKVLFPNGDWAEEANKQSYDDLAASGGIVDAP